MRRAVEPGHVFVGGTPLLHPGYVRINADHFKYLFYAPGFTPETIRELNPKMQWIPLEDDFSLGRYSDPIAGMRNPALFVAAEWLVCFLSPGILMAVLIRCNLNSAPRRNSPLPENNTAAGNRHAPVRSYKNQTDASFFSEIPEISYCRSL